MLVFFLNYFQVQFLRKVFLESGNSGNSIDNVIHLAGLKSVSQSIDLPGKKGHLTYDKNLRQDEIGIKIPTEFKNRYPWKANGRKINQDF